MASLDWTRSRMAEVAEDHGLFVRTYSPGDGLTRYRFFTNPDNGYFGPENGIYTTLGLAEARTFVRAWQLKTRYNIDTNSALIAALEECQRLAIDRISTADAAVKTDVYAADALMGIAKTARAAIEKARNA